MDLSNKSHLRGVALTAILLLAPLAIARSMNGPLSPGPPCVLSGDEPHYLVIINSLIADRDFDLANNYRNSHRGGLDAGKNFAGKPLDHHVNWYRDGQLVQWRSVYEIDPSRWKKDDQGHAVPRLRNHAIVGPPDGREFSQHPVGLAVIMAPLLFPFRETPWVEPAAIACSGLATVGGFCAWLWLVRPYAKCPAHRLMAAQVAYLGSPLWHYGQVLFSESFLAFLNVAAYALALRSEQYLFSGLCLGLGLLIKAPLALLALPLVADALWRRNGRQALLCAVPVALAALLAGYWNQQMYGGFFRNAQAWRSGSIVTGLLGLTLSWERGLLWVAPALVVAGFGLPSLFRQHRRDALLMSAGVLLYGGLMASWAEWWGGHCYSARLVMPIVPFLFVPLVLVLESHVWSSQPTTRFAGAALLAISVVFGTMSAFACNSIWDKHPLYLILGRDRCRSHTSRNCDLSCDIDQAGRSSAPSSPTANAAH